MTKVHQDEIASLQHLLGDVSHKAATEILHLDPSPKELETALLWLREGAIGSEQPTEKTARIYEILSGAQAGR